MTQGRCSTPNTPLLQFAYNVFRIGTARPAPGYELNRINAPITDLRAMHHAVVHLQDLGQIPLGHSGGLTKPAQNATELSIRRFVLGSCCHLSSTLEAGALAASLAARALRAAALEGYTDVLHGRTTPHTGDVQTTLWSFRRAHKH